MLFDGIEREILWKQERSFDENTRTTWPLKMCNHTAMIRLYSFNQYVFFSLGHLEEVHLLKSVTIPSLSSSSAKGLHCSHGDLCGRPLHRSLGQMGVSVSQSVQHLCWTNWESSGFK